jgi:hypothetical protein
MSLIDEALKRARQEAARQDEVARELRYRQVPVIPGLRQPARRSWLLPMLLVIIAACLAVGIGIGLFLSGRRGEDQRAAVPPPPAAAPVAARPEQPVESPQQAEAVPTPEAPPSPVIEEEPAPPVAEPPARPTQEEEPVIADMREREIVLNPAAARPQSAPEARESEPAAPVAPAPAPAAPEPAAPASVLEAGQERIYQQEMPLAGGGTLRLNGIAYSEQPVALFGDKVVGPGESVAGYKVVAIEPRRVRLEGQGGVVVVELP